MKLHNLTLSSSKSALGTTGLLVFTAHIFLGFFAILTSDLIQPIDWWVIAPFCILSIILCILMLYTVVLKNNYSILFEPALFLAISFSIYYSFGPLLYVFGPTEGVELSINWYPINAIDSVRLIGINLIGFGITGLSYLYLSIPIVSFISEHASISWARFNREKIFFSLIAIGGIAKYIFILPFELGLSPIVPNALVRQLGRLLVIALILGWDGRQKKKIIIFSQALLILEICSGFLMFNKTEVLLAIFSTGLGRYLGTQNIKKLIVPILLFVFAFVVLNPIVTFSRNELVHRGNGVTVGAGLVERTEIVLEYFDRGDAFRDETLPGAWWSRLNYLPPQQAAIDLKNDNNGGTDLSILPYIFVPRILYPDKTEMTIAGTDLTEKITGMRLSSTGIGIFIDGYYNLGILGFIIFSITYGAGLRMWRDISEPVVRHESLAMFPIVFLGIFVGLRSDGFWLGDIAGPLILTLVMLLAFRISSK